MNKFTVFVFGASIGCAIGALAALALSPNSGRENREFATEQAEMLGENATSLATDAAQCAEDTIQNLKSQWAELTKVKDKYTQI